MTRSIKNWLIAPLLGVFVLPLLVLGTMLSWQNYTDDKRQTISLQKQLTDLAADKVSVFFHEQETAIVSMLRTNYLPAMPVEQQRSLLSRFLNSIRDKKHGAVFNQLCFLDDHGRERIHISRTAVDQTCLNADRSDTAEFTVPRASGAISYSPIYFDQRTGEPLLNISVPIKDLRTLEFKGLLVAHLQLKFLWDLVGATRIGESGTAYITDQQGRVIAHPNRSIVLKHTVFDVPAEPVISQGLTGRRAVIAAERIRLGDRSLFFVTEVPTAEAFAQNHRAVLLLGSFLLLLLAGSVVLGLIVSRQIIRPIVSLAATAAMISQGDFSQRAETGRTDELGDLATSFNTMTSRLIATIEALKREKDFVRNVIESLTHPFYVIDANDYTIKLANSAANFGEISGNATCYQLTHHTDQPCEGTAHPCVIREIKKTKKPVMVEHVHKTEGGGVGTYEIYGYPIFDEHGEVAQVIEYNVDITERKSLEAQLIQSQKLEAIGSLTGGVAHDFNNFLTTIIGYSQLAITKLPPNDPLRPRMEAIYDAGNRAAALTRQLLAFSRKQIMEVKVINLNTLITNMLKLLGRLIGENIEIRPLLKDSIGNIKADPGQIEQVIMNLTVNARDAMPNGGKLFFETDAIELDENYCRTHGEVTPGSYVVFCVTDTGYGMTPEIKEKIFDPFFTTKKTGEGTGLGLSTVYGIIRQLRGHIFVYSESGVGTTFKIYLPEVTEKADEATVREIPLMEEGTETVLVVDDEASIRQLVVDTLQPLGYDVLEAASGEEAITVAEETDKKIDLLLTDVIMPGMSGKELAEAISARLPDVEVLYMSGYTDNIITHKGVLKPGIRLLNKPLIPSILSRKIRQCLDQ